MEERLHFTHSVEKPQFVTTQPSTLGLSRLYVNWNFSYNKLFLF